MGVNNLVSGPPKSIRPPGRFFLAGNYGCYTHGMAETLTQIIFVGLFFLIASWWIMRPRKVAYGKASTLLGLLDYRFGNDITDQNGLVFRGIEVSIPKKFPHIYIDGHGSDTVMSGPRYVFNKSSRLSLEGDFDTHFQVYAAEEYKSLALSILQPDIMQTLVDHFGTFDIEIYHDKIRIITKQKVFGDDERQFLLADAATKLVNELERRISVWKEFDENTAGKTDLPYAMDTTTKFGKRSIASFTLGLGAILGTWALGIAAAGLWLQMRNTGQDQETAKFFYFLALFFFPGCWLAVVLARRIGASLRAR